MRSFLPVLLLLAPLLATSACAHRHVHHHAPKPALKTVATLDAEHHDAKIVVIHKRPAHKRHCWKHAGHWHCHR